MATYAFDGAERLITLGGDFDLDVKDMYSRWKEWLKDTDGAKTIIAFEAIGGNDIVVGVSQIPAYVYILNGWTIRPQEADHTLNVINGILLRAGGGDPFEDTAGAWTVRINYQQPVQAISVGIGQIYPDVGNIQAMRMMLDAIAAGDVDPPASLPGTLKILKRGSAASRIEATVEADGTRTVTLEDFD